MMNSLHFPWSCRKKIGNIFLRYAFPFFLLLFACPETAFSQCTVDITTPPSGSYCGGEEILLGLIINGGVPPFDVEWSFEGNGEIISSNNTSALVLGNFSTGYIVTVTDDLGNECTDYFNVAPEKISANINQSVFGCDPNPSVLSANIGSGNIPPFTYEWSTGETTQEIEVTTPGPYTVTITNGNGCTATATRTAFIPLVFTTTLTGPAGLCPNTTGVLVASLPNLPGFSSFLWSTGQNTFSNQITIGTPGTYSVTVSNVNTNCTATASIEVPPLAPIEPVLSIPPGICPDGEATIAVSNSGTYSEFIWSNGATTPSITVTEPGTYFVIATEANDCVSDAETTIEEFAVQVPNILGPPDICEGQETSTLTITPTFAEYLWSTDETTPTLTISEAGTYAVTVTDANDCVTENNYEILDAPLPMPAIETGPPPCPGGIAGLLETTGPYAGYLWSNGPTSQFNPVTQPGTYSVTVTTTSGCTGTASAEAVFGNNPVAAIAVVGGNCNVSSTLEASGGSTYAWSTGATTPSITATASGQYTVTVTNATGCTDTETATVSIAPPQQVAISGPPAFCEGGSATLTASTGFNSYAWSNGGTGISTQVAAPGTYAVTATDATGCTATASLSVSTTPAPTPSISGNAGFCPGGATTLQVGGSFANIEWSTGANTPSITVNSPGNYTVTVTNANGCTGSTQQAVQVFSSPTANITGPSSICPGSSAELSVSGNFSTINWSTGASTPSITVSNSASYAVTVTNASGCTGTAQTTVQVLAPPSANIVGPTSICQGSSAELSVAGNFTTINWSTGASTPSITVSSSGSYTVTVTNSAGCTGTDLQAIQVGSTLIPNVAVSFPNCASSATLNAGSGFASYLWSNGATTSSITVGTEGSYAVTVSDGGSCTGTASPVVAFPALPQVGITGPTSACAGQPVNWAADGSFESYAWNTGETTASIAVAQPGTYTVTATNSAVGGCTATASQAFTISAAPTVGISGPTSICTGSSAELIVAGNFSTLIWSTGASTSNINISNSGNYIVTVTNVSGCTATASQVLTVGTTLNPTVEVVAASCISNATVSVVGSYASYLWSNGETTGSISVPSAGNYAVTVSDGSGCTGGATVTVSFPGQPQVSIAAPTVVCVGETVILAAEPGFTNYAWSNGETTASISISQAGSYTLIATDANSCTATASQSVSFLAAPNVDISGLASICTGSSTEFEVVGNFSEITWNTGEVSSNIIVSQSGIYIVTVTDSNGCTATDEQSLTTGSSLAISIGQTSNCDGMATLSVGAGYGSYLWSNGETTEAILVSDEAIYTVTVSESAGGGCTGEATLTTGLLQPPVVAIVGQAAICGGNEVNWTVSGNFAQINWSTGDATNEVLLTAPGLYTVTVTDANGCTATASQMLSIAPALSPTITSTNLPCEATATLSTGSGYASYGWSDGSTGVSIVASQNGSYAVTVTDSDGCTGEASLQITLPVLPQASIFGEPKLCEGYQTELTSADNFSSYQWSTGETGTAITISQGGNYALTVTDSEGCTAEANWSVTLLPTLFSSATAQSCSEQDTGTVTTILTAFTGCDSVVTLTTVLVEAITESVSLSACPGGSVLFDGIEIAAGSSQAFEYVTAAGCDSIVTVSVAALPAVSFATQTTESCWNGSNGSLAVETLSGTPPYTYSLDSGAVQLVPQFNGLAGGSYTLLVEDANACQTSQAIEVPKTEPTEIIVQNRLLYCADTSLTLSAEVLSGNAERLAWKWADGSNEPSLEVSSQGNYAVSVSDGCEEQAFEIQVRLQPSDEEASYFYVPNAFSPNADQTNDGFRAYVGRDVEVRSFELQVYDRWGTQLFASKDSNESWNGLQRGRSMKNEVFVWYLKATVADCKGEDLEIFRKGDLVVMR